MQLGVDQIQLRLGLLDQVFERDCSRVCVRLEELEEHRIRMAYARVRDTPIERPVQSKDLTQREG